ncbi:hypothetical protein PMN51_17740 [Blautia wexlerae]|jgi:hypothetical protein|nr:hypothetical protein [bacterium MSK18_59]MDB6475492.1 hypothetical protein [Blautia wexlerae]
MLASEALSITNRNMYKTDAIEYGIKNLEEKIKRSAEKGYRKCIVDFCSFPYGYNDFVKKYGEENKEHHKLYEIEAELKEYFIKNGFTFKRVTDDICGGVLQAPYWIICW